MPIQPQPPSHEFDILQYSPWLAMDDIDWSFLIENLVPVPYQNGEVLYNVDEIPSTVFLVKEGRVCLSIYSMNGDERIVFIAESGCLLGDVSIINNMPNLCRATVVTNSLIYKIPAYQFREKITANLSLCRNMMISMSRTTQLLILQMKLLSFHNSVYRVCYALIHLVHQYSSPTIGGYKVNMKFSHQDIGNLTGLSRVSVSNILSDMVKHGIIGKSGGFYLIKDVDALYELLHKNEDS